MSLYHVDKTEMYRMMAEVYEVVAGWDTIKDFLYCMDVIWRNLFNGMAKLPIIIIYCTTSFQDAIEGMLILKQTVYIAIYRMIVFYCK